ncbi:MAG: DoxX family protein [Luteibaculaceae bacterium]
MDLLFGIDQQHFLRAGILAFWAILFLQSGLDKVFDFKNNLAWLTGHFKKTIFSGKVGLILALLTIVELMAGIFSLLGFFQVLATGEPRLGNLGLNFSMIALIMLFFGQRLAKDYPGAASLVPYIIFAALSIGYFLHAA